MIEEATRESMAELYLPPDRRDLVAAVRALAREKIAPRAAHYDATATFPHDDVRDLFEAGLLGACIPREAGGLGLGPFRGDVFTLWMLTKEIARADLSFARCWEGHVNSLVIIDGMGTPEQKSRWFEGVLDRGETWVAWSGEPQTRAPGETARFGTYAERVEGGWRLTGNKAFATSAGGARWAILLVNTEGPGGARHATGDVDHLLLMACDLTDPTISVDGSWWDPIGMRATVSHAVRFDGTFIPDQNLIGEPGQYLRESWQTCFAPQYGASFLGAAEAAFDYAIEAIRQGKKDGDPYIQHHVAKMAVNLDTGHLWLRHAAMLWESGRTEEAQVAGNRVRHLLEHLSVETVDHCIRACGARSLNRPSPIERIWRDLSIYVRHDNDDHVLATIGKQILGRSFDVSFYKP
ncbi:MAG TPA: acyl-CoA dehydrogenase family protein [Thermoanaerobaculia bacterium]